MHEAAAAELGNTKASFGVLFNGFLKQLRENNCYSEDNIEVKAAIPKQDMPEKDTPKKNKASTPKKDKAATSEKDNAKHELTDGDEVDQGGSNPKKVRHSAETDMEMANASGEWIKEEGV